MKGTARIKNIGLGITVLLVNGAPLWAADAAQEDSSSVFVWIFLAFCALIVVGQLVPAAMMMLGFAKGVKKGSARPAPEPADHAASPDA
ncbi:MAG: hypothetical protein ACYC7J_05445 [Syntrophales bacterium]